MLPGCLLAIFGANSYCLLHVICWVFGHPVVFGDCFQCLLVIIDEIVFLSLLVKLVVIVGEIAS